MHFMARTDFLQRCSLMRFWSDFENQGLQAAFNSVAGEVHCLQIVPIMQQKSGGGQSLERGPLKIAACGGHQSFLRNLKKRASVTATPVYQRTSHGSAMVG